MGQGCVSVEQPFAVATMIGSFVTVKLTGIVSGPLAAPVPATVIELL